MKKIPMVSHCPACGGALHVTRMNCDACGLMMEGNFCRDEWDGLSREQRGFALVFLRCRGNIREVEKALGISYPTVRARLDEIVTVLGEEGAAQEQISERRTILQALQTGEIGHQEALRRLSALGVDAASTLGKDGE